MKFNLTREQAIRLIVKATDHDDPFWENLVQDFYDEETDSMPTIYDVLRPIGISDAEIQKAEGRPTGRGGRMKVICNKSSSECPDECPHKKPHYPICDIYDGPDDFWRGYCGQEVSYCGFFGPDELIETQCKVVK